MTRRHYFLLALVPVATLAAWHFLSPARQLKAAQQHLVEAISSKNSAAMAKLLHPDYTDQWGFSPADWPGILGDLRRLSPILEINLINPVVDASSGVVDTSLQVKSTGSPASELVEGRAVELKETTRFTWKRDGWQPWSWKLVNVQNPALEIPTDYRPGQLTALPAF